MKKLYFSTIITSLIFFCCSCSVAEQREEELVEKTDEIDTYCTNPRLQICTKEYMPVCATKDTGIRCVTTPCPSTEKQTYSTGCTACSDEKVRYYVPGQCESPKLIQDKT